MCEPPGSRQGGDARGGPCERSSHHRRRAASREERGAMRGTGQPLCSQTRTATCCSTCAALELWLLLQLNSLLRVPYVRMHFRPSDQASWVVASHKARFSGPGRPTSCTPPAASRPDRHVWVRRPSGAPGSGPNVAVWYPKAARGRTLSPRAVARPLMPRIFSRRMPGSTGAQSCARMPLGLRRVLPIWAARVLCRTVCAPPPDRRGRGSRALSPLALVHTRRSVPIDCTGRFS